MIGVVNSTDFLTMTASDPTYNGGRWDTFVFAVNASGGRLLRLRNAPEILGRVNSQLVALV